MKKVSLTPAVFHLSEEVNAIASGYAENPVVPRGPGLQPVLERVKAKLISTLGEGEDYTPVIFTSSGSGAVAAAIGSCVDEKGILIVSNGAYGERQVKYASQLGLKVIHYELEYGDRPDLKKIEVLIKKHDVGTLGIVHGCTSTCNLNPIKEIGRITQKFNVRYIVDGIASIFVEELKLDKWGIDVLIGSANKGLHSNPDLSFVLVADKTLTALEKIEKRIPYFDIVETAKAQNKGSHPYTINIRSLLELDAALDNFINNGGIEGRMKVYGDRTRILREGYKKLGLKIFKKNGMPFQHIGTALFLPREISYEDLAEKLADYKNEKNESFEIYSAQGKLSGKVFRIFNMGEYSLDTYERFIEALGNVLNEMKP